MKSFVQKLNSMRCIAVFLVALVVCSFFAILNVQAANDSGKVGELEWSLSGGTLEIKGKGEMPNFTEQKMAPWNKYGKDINRISIDSRITKIGSLAFYDCSAVRTIELSKNVKIIGDMAFAGCSTLEKITFPGIEKIGKYAFSRCFKLSGVVLPSTLKEIGDNAFYRCESLVSIVIPSSVQKLGSSVFAYCSSLLSVVINAPVEELPEWTFYGCTNLVDVTLPKETVSVGDNAFTDCDNLLNIYHNGTDKESEEFLKSIKETEPDFKYGVVKPADEDTEPTTSLEYQKDGDVGYKTQTEVITGNDADIQINTTTTHEVKGEYDFGTEVEDAKIEISSTVKNEDGWETLIEEIEDQFLEQGAFEMQIGNNVKVPITVDISLVNDSYIYGKDLETLAGKDIVLKVTTPNGSRWSIDCSMLRNYTFKKKYNLEYEISLYEDVSKAHQKVFGVVTSYWLTFKDKIDFPTTVEPYVDLTAARFTATLYEKTGISKLNLIQSVQISGDGVAYYKMANINKGKRYIIALNVATVLPQDVIKPDEDIDWLENYVPITEQYKITDVRGFMGLTMKQFTNILIFGVIGLAFVVFIVMLTLNFMAKKKALEQLKNKK